ncbi:hypothetical protein [Bacillus subtilis]|uniref:hypothetical protein n=1 Tax=Bacillus subtilis TaxID=1423 RepID=UPI0015E6C8CA|nr:hypothetical protein [Bacillus subtilis]MED4559852.1 hypothetical protein [Bacillus subtilis]
MSITFVRKDKIDSFVSTAIEIANHFSVKRESCLSLIKVIRTKWSIDNIPKLLMLFKTKFSLFEDGQTLIDILEKAVSECNDDYDLNKLRGTLTEGLLLGRYSQSIVNAETFGWGAQVVIMDKDGYPNELKYHCPSHNDENNPECFSRTTVDLGFWNGEYGEFFECKVRPDRIKCPEMSYMKYLNRELTQSNIKHNLYFVTTDTLDSMRMKVKKDHPNENFFKIISLQETSA